MNYFIKLFSISFFTLLLVTVCFSQDVTLTSQAEVDAFDPSTTSIAGNLTIQESSDSTDPIVDLSNLSNLNAITGYLQIRYNAVLPNLDGLVNLTSVGGYLSIEDNASLPNLDGLSNFTSIGGSLQIWNNAALTNLTGLLNLTSFGEHLYIWNNDALTNLDGLSNLTSLGGAFQISNNAVLTNMDGLSNLISIGGSLSIYNNAVLPNLDGLSNLTSVGGGLSIEDNASLLNLDGLSNLTSIGGSLQIWNNTALANLDGLANTTSVVGGLYINNNDALLNLDGLSNLTSIGQSLQIWDNAVLTNLDGLANTIVVHGGLFIEDNTVLTNLDGLANTTFVDGDLNIWNNVALQNLDGLANLISINGDLIIEDNITLTNCCGIQDLLNTPGAISGTIIIFNNPLECSSENEVLNAACGLSMKIFNDFNEDCINDNGEIGVANRKFIIQPGDIIGETNLGGRWNLDSLPLGDYTITIDTSGKWSSTCPITQSFTIINPYEESILPSFGLISTEPCPAPDISVHMPFMRPCFENQYIYIQACNTYNATGVLEDAFVTLELDSLLIPTSSSIPYVVLGDNLYQFDIGTLNPGVCAEFWMETMLSCDAVLGQSLCMEANMFPAADCVFDEIPNPFPPSVEPCNTEWDKSSLSVEGYCQNDSIFFEITNTGDLGEGDMTCFSPIYIYIDGELMIVDSIQLLGEETVQFNFSGDGESWHLQTAQHPLHPGNLQPNVTVENCGGMTAQTAINAFAHDDADPVVDIYCGEVTGSYDPNDKTGFPLGINESNDILPNQQMEYLIRFQNTGTDTAFTVVIRDTLSTDFDIFSVESGAASHSYDFNMYGSRIMEWTFNNILLPDSTTNEAASHGFIKFKVNQIPNLPEGTVLENSAGIYFDFNDPIITNTSQHTINYFIDNFITTSIFEEHLTTDNEFASSVSIYPNPASNYVSVDLGKIYQGVNLTLRNVLGQTIFNKEVNAMDEFQFEINEASGLYLLEIKTETGESATFKILKN